MRKPVCRIIQKLWKQFANALGVDDVDLAKTEKQTETKNLIDAFARLVAKDRPRKVWPRFTLTNLRSRRSVNRRSTD